ncbi:MAG TPA: hypothetical protein VD794_06275 [Flavisolibacter sp.]|nr:hypothetical protein [Flavisolibacter sp.]
MTDLNKINIYNELHKVLEDHKRKQFYFFFDDYITISLDSNNWLYVDWIGYQTENSVMEGCEKMLEALKYYNVSKVLNDNTRVIGIWTPAAEWVGVNWLPRMETAGLKQFAWVYSSSRLSQVSTDEAIKSTPLPKLIQTFYDISEAQKWLMQA